jgi:hypothetical protein
VEQHWVCLMLEMLFHRVAESAYARRNDISGLANELRYPKAFGMDLVSQLYRDKAHVQRI